MPPELWGPVTVGSPWKYLFHPSREGCSRGSPMVMGAGPNQQPHFRFSLKGASSALVSAPT